MKYFWLFGFLFATSISASSQGVAPLLDSAKSIWYIDFDKTDQFVKKAEEIVSISGKDGMEFDLIRLYDLRIQSCINFSLLSLWKRYMIEFDSLLAEFKPALRTEDLTLFRLKNEISRAQYYFEINDDRRALEMLEQVQFELKGSSLDKKKVCEYLYYSSNYIAGIHQRRGEYEAAINQHLASIAYFECKDDQKSDSFRALIYRNIGLVYLQRREYDQVSKYLRLAEGYLLDILAREPLKVSRMALSLYETQSSYYEQIGRRDSALMAMGKAIPLLRLPNVDNEFRGRINQSLGNLYLLEGKFKEAKRHFDEAEAFFLKSESRKSFYVAGLYLMEATLFENQGNIPLALDFCRKAFEKLVLNFKPDVDGNPSLQDVLSKKQLFNVLQKKARLEERLFEGNNNIKALIRAFNTNQLSLAVLDSTANEFSLDKDKIILSEQSYSAFEDGIRISNELYHKTREEKYFTSVISLIEKSKGNLLLENLRLVNRFSGLKQEWLELEKELKAEMLLTEQSMYQAEGRIEKAIDLQKSRERYAKIKRDYGTLIEKIKREAPEYYKLRFDHSVVSLEVVQQQLLRDNEALVEFFVGDSILAVAGFTNGKKYLNVKPLLPDFTAKMNQFRTALTTSNSNFLELSSEFYDFLLKDCLNELGPEIKSLTIVPDGLLGYLPFEILVQSKDPKAVYLNDKISIHYANSATYLMEQMNRKPSDAQNFFAGFVSSGTVQIPTEVVTRDQQFAALQGAEHEVASITDLLSSGFTVFSPANKMDFIKKASEYKVLHFAMHSSLNDKNPMMSVMIFAEADSTENLLSAIEMYAMKLNSELAVLSACNTGVGQLHRGEGIMSFSRAFAYAGVPSAVISLWKVPDIATSKIMVSFYSHLKNGETKDKALQLARQDFVKNNPEMAHPFFWAGFILTGNNSPLTFPRSYFWLWIAVSVLVLSGLVIARKKISFRA